MNINKASYFQKNKLLEIAGLFSRWVHYYFSVKIPVFLTILQTANAQADKNRMKDSVQDLLTVLYLALSYEVMKNNRKELQPIFFVDANRVTINGKSLTNYSAFWEIFKYVIFLFLRMYIMDEGCKVLFFVLNLRIKQNALAWHLIEQPKLYRSNKQIQKKKKENQPL